MKTIMLGLYQSIGGDIRLLRDDSSTRLEQHQIAQLGLHLFEVEEFDYYEYVRAYVNSYPSDDMVERWKGQPLFSDAQADLDILYYTTLEPDGVRVTVFSIKPTRAVVVISSGDEMNPDRLTQIITRVVNRVLPGVVQPGWVSWFYQGPGGVFRLNVILLKTRDLPLPICRSCDATQSDPRVIHRMVTER